jgi:Tol biopolymer transport system component/DNA-binding winged helix-turn-helix (wHTH) protein
MSHNGNHLYQFGDFSLDSVEKVLWREGKPLPLTPKTLELLRVLVKNHGQIVEKEKLMSEVWADCFVEDSNLTFTIRQLRKVLADDAHQPTYIETVPRRGYRFIAEVRETDNDNGSIKGAEQISPQLIKKGPAGSKRNIKFLASLAALLVVGIIVAGFWNAGGKSANDAMPILSAPFSSEKLSTNGKVRHAVISPDGKIAAYVDQTGDKQGVWLKNLKTSANSQLVPLSDDHYLGISFAHSSDQLFFVRKPAADSARSAVYRVSIFGGAPEKIAEQTEGWIGVSPDDEQISFVRCQYRAEDFCSLFVADISGRRERKILTRPEPIRIGDNQFSPDGKSIAFAVGQSWGGGSDFRLMSVSLETGEESRISPKTFFNIKNLEWLPNGDELLLTANETINGKIRIWRVSINSGEAEPLTKDANNYVAISLNKAADKILATVFDDDFQLSISANGAARTLTSASRATFAPDGKLFYSTKEGDIWTIKPDGSEQRQLTNDVFNDFNPRVSPDNQWIYFASNRTGANQVWRMTTDGGNQMQVTTKEGGYPCFVSADGKRIYYESGLHQTLWQVSADGEETQVSDRKLNSPAFSPDGNLVAYFFRDKEWKIGVMNIADNKQTKILNYAEGKSIPVSLAWSADNRTLNFITNYDSKNLLWQQSLDENQPRLVADLGDKTIQDFALAPAGGNFAYVRGKWIHDAVLINGFK